MKEGVFIFLFGDGRSTLANVLVQTVETVSGEEKNRDYSRHACGSCANTNNRRMWRALIVARSQIIQLSIVVFDISQQIGREAIL